LHLVAIHSGTAIVSKYYQKKMKGFFWLHFASYNMQLSMLHQSTRINRVSGSSLVLYGHIAPFMPLSVTGYGYE